MNCFNPQYSDGMDCCGQNPMSDMASWYMDQGYPPCGMPPRMIQPRAEINSHPSSPSPWMPAETGTVMPGTIPTSTEKMTREQNPPIFGEMLSRFPIGMGYVPMQRWSQPSQIDEAFCRGTLFSELDLPFVMGRCI